MRLMERGARKPDARMARRMRTRMDERVRNARKAVERRLPASRIRRERRRGMIRSAAGVVAGSAAAYFFDPARGKARRRETRDRAAGMARRLSRRGARGARKMASDVGGLRQRLARRTRQYIPPNDATLADKVRSEALTPDRAAGASVNVNVEDGVVALRGTVRNPGQIRELEDAVRRVPGVRNVESFLHLPKTPAPNKQDARHIAS